MSKNYRWCEAGITLSPLPGQFNFIFLMTNPQPITCHMLGFPVEQASSLWHKLSVKFVPVEQASVPVAQVKVGRRRNLYI
ncbi:MAG: hypothetical protein F6K47_24675 [Symploca sp. SIO2E6]|nr:hypothetical protein [Symploca sp. SIO2E6]